MIKIAFSGSPGMEKEETIQNVRNYFLDKGYHVELAQQQQPAANAKPFGSSFYLMSEQINRENFLELSDPDILFANGCVLDAFVYWNCVGQRMPQRTSASSAKRS